MKYGRILSATQRDGVIFPHFFVTRRAQTPVCFSPYSLNCEKWLPSLTTCICRYTLVTDSKDNIFADTNQNQLFEDALLWLGARRD